MSSPTDRNDKPTGDEVGTHDMYTTAFREIPSREEVRRVLAILEDESRFEELAELQRYYLKLEQAAAAGLRERGSAEISPELVADEQLELIACLIEKATRDVRAARTSIAETESKLEEGGATIRRAD